MATRLTKVARAGASMAVLALVATASGCDWARDWFRPKAPDVRFGSYTAAYESKPDFAQLEFQFPLTSEELARITPEKTPAVRSPSNDGVWAQKRRV